MLSKSSMKSKSGISKIAIILIVVIVIVAIVTGVLYFIITKNDHNDLAINENEEDIVWDTNNEITRAEKNKLKDTYLGVFSLLVSNKYQTEEENLVEAASQIIKLKEEGKLDDTTSSTSLPSSMNSSTTNSMTENQTNTSTTNISDTSSANPLGITTSTSSTASANLSTGVTGQTQTVVNDTVVVTGQNPALQNTTTSNTTGTNSATTNTATGTTTNNVVTETNTLGTNTADSNSVGQSSTGSLSTTTSTTDSPNSDEVASAIDEIYGKTVDNLDSILSSNKQTIVPGFVTEIVSISKANGVYSIKYKVCWPTNADLTKYGTIDKINTNTLDTLESTTIEIELVKNREFDYSEYKVKSIQVVDTQTPVAYYLSFANGKYGVIDQNGVSIINNLYDWITIPNNYRDLFICQTGTTTTALNKSGTTDERFSDYSNLSAIISASDKKWWYEKDFLVYSENGKYGAVDADGFVIFEPIYDKIDPLFYLVGELIITQNGRQALGDITGDVKNFKYSKIGVLGGQFDASALVNSQTTLEQVKQKMNTGMYILGQDSDGIIEQIKVITPEEFALDNNTASSVAYPETIADWKLTNVQGFSIYVK